MLDENFNIKFIDFGDARKVNEQDEEDKGEEHMSRTLLRQMRRDTYVGTLNYLSPEVTNGAEQGCPVDIWAMGCILFKMFVGTVPFRGEDPWKVQKDIWERNIQWP